MATLAAAARSAAVWRRYDAAVTSYGTSERPCVKTRTCGLFFGGNDGRLDGGLVLRQRGYRRLFGFSERLPLAQARAIRRASAVLPSRAAGIMQRSEVPRCFQITTPKQRGF